ncbi:hypothetical protein JIG36_38045 [Actinoplanes sp. LDG1-06]|uniref:Lipoprotein n=1 Tax=Paractinoplanes ovalisporus TaxID=2810368 RepID=A0ABS2AQ14_9ACTN|nr:hypothetical protein [Actinoplanes ovalisporus]MBM2621321.1 hypothetical protein [Actinoplanes ovalisporus]
MRMVAALVGALLLAGCSGADDTPGNGSSASADTRGSGSSAPADTPGSGASATPGRGSGGTPGSGTGGTRVDCAHDIGGRPPDNSYRLVLDAVALPTGRLQTAGSGEPGRLFAKTGLLVRAGTEVELTATTEDVTIGWGSPGPEATTITVPACPSAAGWLAFPGGYHVPKPMCVNLIVRAHGREERAEVRVGADC